ncbi:MAG: hypothetical protein CFE23_06290 [Flavobacterium sp. BFFFF1]|uniref:hypothetical protein n=1 Tax=unclassified Flavobacterium TaxID=196869 RepID=UPI000BC5A5A0|nr:MULTISPECIES: hypothetical protein [unclassified Flavobacterium]OYU81096.1 MAG: hypothetical protein CFE23_06290 [Flavobacterium sp. BFFFF1]
MKRTTIVTIFCVTLVALNLFLIISGLMHKEGRRQRPEAKRDIIIRELHLDQKQISRYDEMIDWHRSEIRRTDERIMDLKRQLYLSLDQVTPNQKSNDSIMNLIGKVQVEVEQIHYDHFRDIKRLCRKDQLPAYSRMAAHIADIFSGPKPPQR